MNFVIASVFLKQDTRGYSSQLSIGHADPSHNGNYTCTAENDAESVSYTAAFHVDGNDIKIKKYYLLNSLVVHCIIPIHLNSYLNYLAITLS